MGRDQWLCSLKLGCRADCGLCLPPSSSLHLHSMLRFGLEQFARFRIQRLINELPLVLVILVFLWAQYTISISLVHSYLVRTRNLVGLGLLIAIPFNLSWFASLVNLCKCVITGPGWVQRLHQPTIHHALHAQAAAQSTSSVSQHHGGFEHSDHDDDDEGDHDEDQNIDSQAQDQVPLLSSQNNHPSSSSSNPNAPFSHPPDRQLSPRPALTCTSPPPYPAHPSVTSASNLSFQEQVQRQQSSRSPHSAVDIFHALHFPPSSTLNTPSRPNQPDREEDLTTSSNQQIETLMCKSDGSLRFCRKCNHLKADRSHHCSSCEKCVLRMDHHCPWLGGRCVGLNNHKFFILFLFYTTITCAFSALFAARGLLEFVSDPSSTVSNDSNSPNFELAPLNWALLVLVGGLFGMVLAGFTSYHLYLISVNRTTIENMERSVRVRPTSSNRYIESYALLRTTRLKRPENLRREMEVQDLTVHNNTGQMNMHAEASNSGSNIMLSSRAQIDRRAEENIETYDDDMNNLVPSSQPVLPSYDLPIYKSDHQLTRVERKKLESGSTKLNLFDRGSTLANFKEIFGNRSPFWHWFLPFNPIGYVVNAHASPFLKIIFKITKRTN